MAFFDRIEGFKRILSSQRKKEEDMKKRNEEFFSRFVSTDEEYAAYLSHMEEATALGLRDMRFSFHPSYLKKKILLHTPLSGEAP